MAARQLISVRGPSGSKNNRYRAAALWTEGYVSHNSTEKSAEWRVNTPAITIIPRTIPLRRPTGVPLSSPTMPSSKVCLDMHLEGRPNEHLAARSAALAATTAAAWTYDNCPFSLSSLQRMREGRESTHRFLLCRRRLGGRSEGTTTIHLYLLQPTPCTHQFHPDAA